jgi:two-component system phosphate regulon sensor histidine kinase PhoR
MERDRGELAALMGAISDGILAVDLEGSPLFFNSRFALLFMPQEALPRSAAASTSEGVQAPPRIQDLFDDSELLLAYARALGGEQPSPTPIRRRSEAEGKDRYFSVSVAPLRREDSAVYGAVGVFHDITELKQAEQIRIDFVANVSHELRTPLTSIKGYTDTLLEDAAQARWESAPRFLSVISRNVDRLMSLIQDLLDLSWLESGGELQLADVDLRELTQRVLGQLESLRGAKGHQIESEVSARQLRADPRRVEQVMVNLLENAIKYVPAGEGRIVVRWLCTDQSVRLIVSDNGPGIPPVHQDRLFERFYRVDKARSRELGGTGLGLAIVKHILQAHGGTVTVRSELGKGSEFVCDFPLAKAVQA